MSLEANSTSGFVKHLRLVSGYLKQTYFAGHERSLTQIKFNKDGDLLFSCSKDHIINVWYTHNGERLGTYDGHNGTVWTIDVDSKSRLFVTEGYVLNTPPSLGLRFSL